MLAVQGTRGQHRLSTRAAGVSLLQAAMWHMHGMCNGKAHAGWWQCADREQISVGIRGFWK